MYLYVNCSIIYDSQDMETTQGLINRWIDKEDVQIYDEYYSAIKKNEHFALCYNMDGYREYYAKWKKSDREKLSDFTYMWNLQTKTDEVNMTKQRQTYRYTDQMAAIELEDGEVKK